MDATQVIFIVSAALIVASALMVVTSRNLVHAALWLIATLFGVGILYVLLEAGFLAVVQVVVYIGAIAIMFIFAVMLTRRDMLDHGPQVNASWPVALALSVFTFVGLGFILNGFGYSLNHLPGALPPNLDPLLALGNALVSPQAFVLPFEVASVLLLAALVGAVYVARNHQ
ncbi:MAG: NADH-quinone oxidoreductase subunit J [Anaerolineales bacterium]